MYQGYETAMENTGKVHNSEEGRPSFTSDLGMKEGSVTGRWTQGGRDKDIPGMGKGGARSLKKCSMCCREQ